MKVVILAGGLGTRLSEETGYPSQANGRGGRQADPVAHHEALRPMASTSSSCVCGYKGEILKEWFVNYGMHNPTSPSISRPAKMAVHRLKTEPWRVTLVDTGEETLTGGRVKRVGGPRRRDFRWHTATASATSTSTHCIATTCPERPKATVTAVQPPGRFGALELGDAAVPSFREKPAGEDGVGQRRILRLEPSVFD